MEKENKSPTIIVRDLEQFEIDNLEELKEHLHIKTNSRVVRHMISRYMNMHDMCQSQRETINDLEYEVKRIKSKIIAFNIAIKDFTKITESSE